MAMAGRDPACDPGSQEAQRRHLSLGEVSTQPLVVGGCTIRVGTAGWTDPTLIRRGVFYPDQAKTAEGRLRFYASRFSLAEIDSSYYALPTRRNAELWSNRTPEGFLFDVKAHALMTGQPTEVKRLPAEIRKALPIQLKNRDLIYASDLPEELYEAVWMAFRDGIEPLSASGKMGSVLLQYPRWFSSSEVNRDTILDARRRLNGFACAVELRNGSWLTGHAGQRTLDFLTDRQIPFVMVDGPQGMKSSIPPIVAVTSAHMAVLRFHGRRTETWEQSGVGVSEKYRYLYNSEQLSSWASRIQDVALRTQQIHVIMNNCYANYAVTNALELVKILGALNE